MEEPGARRGGESSKFRGKSRAVWCAGVEERDVSASRGSSGELTLSTFLRRDRRPSPRHAEEGREAGRHGSSAKWLDSLGTCCSAERRCWTFHRAGHQVAGTLVIHPSAAYFPRALPGDRLCKVLLERADGAQR